MRKWYICNFRVIVKPILPYNVPNFDSNIIIKAMKHAVKTLIKSPAAVVIIILLFLLVLLFTVRAITQGGEVVNNIDQGESITHVEYAKSR